MLKPLLAALTIVSFAAPAFAADKCSVPKAEWASSEALSKKLTDEGWRVKKIKADAGCWEVYGFDKDGKKRETYFNPKTLEPISLDGASDDKKPQ